jgi:hypothetical protein
MYQTEWDVDLMKSEEERRAECYQNAVAMVKASYTEVIAGH